MPLIGSAPVLTSGATFPPGWRFGPTLYAIGAITWGVVDADGVEWHMEQLDGWFDSADVVGQSTKIPDSHGVFLGPAVYNARMLTALAVIVARDTAARDAARFRLSQAMPVGSLVDITVDGSPALTTRGRLSGQLKCAPLNEQALRIGFTLLCPDPRRYLPSPPEVSLLLPSAAAGANLPNNLPFALPSNGNASAGVAVTNLGDMDAPWSARIAGPVTTPILTNLTTGAYLGVAVSLGTGDYLDIDCREQTVLLNGQVSRSGLITNGSQWWSLPPNSSSVIRFNAGGSAPAPGTPQVLFVPQSAWS